MHDWVLVDVRFEWETGALTVAFRNARSETVYLEASGVRELRIPKAEEWGRSSCVNEVRGPAVIGDALRKLEIEMQSGDCLEIVASTITLPKCP